MTKIGNNKTVYGLGLRGIVAVALAGARQSFVDVFTAPALPELDAALRHQKHTLTEQQRRDTLRLSRRVLSAQNPPKRGRHRTPR